MGYDVGRRDEIYADFFKQTDSKRLLELLQANRIDYVAIDDGLRHGPFAVDKHEAVFAACCPVVFEDKEKRLWNLKIYRVPH